MRRGRKFYRFDSESLVLSYFRFFVLLTVYRFSFVPFCSVVTHHPPRRYTTLTLIFRIPAKPVFFFVSSFSRLTLSFIKSAHEGKVIDSFHYFQQLGLLLDTVPRLIPEPNKTPRPRPHRHPLQSIPRTISSLLPHHLVVLEGITIVSGYRCVG